MGSNQNRRKAAAKIAQAKVALEPGIRATVSRRSLRLAKFDLSGDHRVPWILFSLFRLMVRITDEVLRRSLPRR
ncbi:MAG: hypothetical protein ACJAUG_003158 [Halioglobus sp.]|jgi:hypothetical protein